MLAFEGLRTFKPFGWEKTDIMSSDSLAVFRKSLGPELNKLAEEHMQHEYELARLLYSLARNRPNLLIASDNQTEMH